MEHTSQHCKDYIVCISYRIFSHKDCTTTVYETSALPLISQPANQCGNELTGMKSYPYIHIFNLYTSTIYTYISSTKTNVMYINCSEMK